MSNHKLIMENWRSFIDPNNNLILENQAKESKVLLNSGRSVTFGKLLESYDNKKISAERLSEVVLNDIDKTPLIHKTPLPVGRFLVCQGPGSWSARAPVPGLPGPGSCPGRPPLPGEGFLVCQRKRW